MFKRRPNSPGASPDSKGAGASSAREAISEATWAARDRVVVWFGPTAKTVADAVKPQLERVAFGLQRGLFWPIEDRAGAAGRPTRALAFGAVLLLAVGTGVAGLVWAAPGGHHSPAVTRVATESSQPLAAVKAGPKAPTGPTLHGVAPVFKPAVTRRPSKVDPAKPTETASLKPSSSSASSGASSTGALASSAKRPAIAGPPAGPMAISVARKFGGAFVLYETGRSDSSVRKAFDESATPELSRSLIRRPPRLPANVTVPQAKVVNVVAAPSHGRVYPVSVSLLRVGITSELRLEMEQLKDKGWQVTNVLG